MAYFIIVLSMFLLDLLNYCGYLYCCRVRKICKASFSPHWEPVLQAHPVCCCFILLFAKPGNYFSSWWLYGWAMFLLWKICRVRNVFRQPVVWMNYLRFGLLQTKSFHYGFYQHLYMSYHVEITCIWIDLHVKMVVGWQLGETAANWESTVGGCVSIFVTTGFFKWDVRTYFCCVSENNIRSFFLIWGISSCLWSQNQEKSKHGVFLNLWSLCINLTRLWANRCPTQSPE